MRVVVAAGAALLHDRQPAELAAPDDQRRVEQAALLAGRSAAPAIGCRSRRRSRRWLSAMLVWPSQLRSFSIAAGVDLHEAHAALDQPAGDQALLGEVRALRVVEAVELLRSAAVSRVDVERLGGGHLHAVGQLEALDAGRQVRPRRRAVPGAAG